MPDKDSPACKHQIVCPWWFCFSFDNFIRKPLHNPEQILKPYIKQSWTVLDVGPGMGYFTIPLAKMVGNNGKVIAADLQPKMIEGVRRRAIKAGVADRVKLHQAAPDKIGINEPLDFCLAFWMVHEVPDRPRFIGEIASNLKQGGLFLLVEPKLHVSKESFAATLEIARNTGLTLSSHLKVFMSRAALFRKQQ